jgi:hypothetical protein
MPNLSDAIQLIRQGRKEEARQPLEAIIKAEPQNIPAWFWYVETCPTSARRIQVLEMCLKMNPGNSQVMQALQTLRSQQTSQTAFVPPPVQPPKPIIDEAPKRPAPSLDAPAYFSNKPDRSPAVTGSVSQPSSLAKTPTWEKDTPIYVKSSPQSKPQLTAKSYTFYEAWLKVLTTFDVESYESVLDDPEAGAGRAFEWVAYVGILSGIISPLLFIFNPQFEELANKPELKNLFGNMSSTSLLLILTLVMIIFVPINSMIGLAISAGFQNFLAGFFGGKGYFGRTAYALAAYIAPISILTTLLGIVPLVGSCLSSLLALYSVSLNVRALRASHSLSTGQAITVIFIPGIVMMILMCLIFFAVLMPAVQNLPMK